MRFIVLVIVVSIAPSCVDRAAEERRAAAEVHLKLGEEALVSGNFRRAVAAAELAVQYDPAWPAARDLMLRSSLAVIASTGPRLGPAELVRADYQAETIQPRDQRFAYVYRTVRAQAALARGELPAAADHLRAAIEQNEAFAGAHATLAQVHVATKNPEALAEFERAIQLAPSNFVALAQAGRLHLEKSSYTKAAEYLIRALAIDETPELHGNLAIALAASNRAEQAISHLQRAITLEPRNGDFRMRLGELQLSIGRIGDSEITFRQAVEAGGGPLAARSLGIVLLQKPDAEGARQALSSALQNLPDDPTSLYSLGVAYEALNKNSEAITFYRRYSTVAVLRPEEVERLAAVKQRLTKLGAR